MPLPLIPILIGLGALFTGGAGVKKGIDGCSDMRAALRIRSGARRRYESAKQRLESMRQEVNEGASAYGLLQLRVLDTTVRRFLQFVERLGQSGAIGDIRELESLGIEHAEIVALQGRLIQVEPLLTGGVRAVGAGAAAAGSATALVGLLGTASTGTAIGSLSGAAATNATLAWLGGGSLASGGLGMAGGAVVLCGVAIGPALLVAGFVLASQGKKAVTRAKEHEADLDRAVAEMAVLQTALTGVERRLHELTGLLARVDVLAAAALDALEAEPFDLLNDAHCRRFQSAATFIRGLGHSLRTPVLNDEQELNLETVRVVLHLRDLAAAH